MVQPTAGGAAGPQRPKRVQMVTRLSTRLCELGLLETGGKLYRLDAAVVAHAGVNNLE